MCTLNKRDFPTLEIANKVRHNRILKMRCKLPKFESYTQPPAQLTYCSQGVSYLNLRAIHNTTSMLLIASQGVSYLNLRAIYNVVDKYLFTFEV